MNEVISKRHFFKFYINLFASAALSLFFSVLLFSIFLSQYSKETHLHGKYYFLVIIAISCLGFTFYYIAEYFKKAPSISINNSNITFGKTSFKISDINYIKFSGKRDFIFSGLECTMIVFKNNTAKVIYDDMYTNAPELKAFLDNIVNNKTPYIVKEIENVTGQQFEYHKGYFWLNFNTLSISAILILFLVFSIKSLAFFIFTIIFSFVLFYMVLANHFNYIGLNDNYIVIKNRLKFWRKDIYNISDIELISFEFPKPKSPNSIKLILKDYTSKEYYIAGLNNKTLRQLKIEFQRLNINIRNELHI